MEEKLTACNILRHIVWHKEELNGKKKKKKKTYNTGCSLVVTVPATNPALTNLSWEIGRDPDFYGGSGRMYE